nr:MAG TPA: acriflavine resistance protein B [Caudoviricetes sp.]
MYNKPMLSLLILLHYVFIILVQFRFVNRKNKKYQEKIRD